MKKYYLTIKNILVRGSLYLIENAIPFWIWNKKLSKHNFIERGFVDMMCMMEIILFGELEKLKWKPQAIIIIYILLCGKSFNKNYIKVSKILNQIDRIEYDFIIYDQSNMRNNSFKLFSSNLVNNSQLK